VLLFRHSGSLHSLSLFSQEVLDVIGSHFVDCIESHKLFPQTAFEDAAQLAIVVIRRHCLVLHMQLGLCFPSLGKRLLDFQCVLERVHTQGNLASLVHDNPS